MDCFVYIDYIFIILTQPALTNSKSTMKIPMQCEIWKIDLKCVKTDLKHCPSVSIVNSEQVNVSWTWISKHFTPGNTILQTRRLSQWYFEQDVKVLLAGTVPVDLFCLHKKLFLLDKKMSHNFGWTKYPANKNVKFLWNSTHFVRPIFCPLMQRYLPGSNKI